MWYKWDSLEAFDAWHNSLMVELGYPLISVNQATGLPDPTAQGTETYTQGYEVEGKIIAVVDLEYANELTPTDLRREKPKLDAD
jgi:hypothetical protein